MLIQFVSAFDDTIIKRYDENRVVKNTVEVRYVLSPKQRVMHDIVNKAQNLTLPVVAVSVSNIRRDETRVFNKNQSIYNYLNEKESRVIKMPVPVNLTVNMSILAKFQEDLDQILTNFVPYNNPYIILSWKEPTNTGDTFEIRSEVLWDGNIAITSPTDTTYSDKFHVIADTTFEIKGWIFKTKNELTAPIYFIDTNFTAVNKYNLLQFESLSGDTDATYTDSIRISGYPQITDIFLNRTGSVIPVDTTLTVNTTLTSLNTYLLYGDNYNHTTAVLISSNNNTLTSGLTSLSSARMGVVSGFPLSLSNYSILNDNIMSVNLPELSATGIIDLLIVNPAGHISTYSVNELNFATLTL